MNKILLLLFLFLLSCSNIRMGCTLNDNKAITSNNTNTKDTLSDKAQECINNPTVIIFKEF
jgi:hypothetical protein